jgi:hypothetical protein
MIKAQECKDCIHEEVCKKKGTFENACKQVENNIPNHILCGMSINIACNHFKAKTATQIKAVRELN